LLQGPAVHGGSGFEECRGGGLGDWSAKTGWGPVDDLVKLVCVTFRLQAGERRELAEHLPPEHLVGSGLSPDGEAGRLATPDQCLLQGGPPTPSAEKRNLQAADVEAGP
jgi:hypothetical protein